MAEAETRVAIIGAGWAGIQLLQSLQELGIGAEVFDKLNAVGGTWTPQMSYSGLSLHSPRWINGISSHGKIFPWVKDDDESWHSKPDAQEVHTYLNDYVDHHGLRSKIHCNAFITEICHCSKSQQVHIKVQLNGQLVQRGPFSLVVFSAMSGKASMPRIPNNKFEGRVLHSHEVKDEVLKEVVRKNLRVLILGGGKSGCDMIQACQKMNHSNLIWLMRAPYWFMRHEAASHRRTLLGKLRAFLVLTTVPWFLLKPRVGIFLTWLLGVLIQPAQKGLPAHFDPSRFHLGILDRSQEAFIKEVTPKIGEPKSLEKEGMLLESGEKLPCDVVVYATGYETGFDDIRTVKDGEEVDVRDDPLYHHTVAPRFPSLLVAPTAYTNFGPIRGVTMAQYITYYLAAKPSEAEMLRVARKNWCRQRPKQFLLFGGQVFMREYLYMFLDFVRGGILPFSWLLKAMWDLFINNLYRPLPLSVGVQQQWLGGAPYS